MRNSVLICDDQVEYLGSLVKPLFMKNVPVTGVRYIDDASDILFSPEPPAVFIADLRGKRQLTRESYEFFRQQLNADGETHGDTGVHGLIRDVQNRVPDVRIILISAINPDVSARKLGVFAYIWKGETGIFDNLSRVCLLGPLHENEIDITGKLKDGPLDLGDSQAVNQYIERKFSVKREREI
ncbi:MAG: hypothetical protein NT149_04750 [Candidatus Gottesmanbacteria bacterium]|nr:hypothetical protein [Candidatus Gottesmanbacteria bacterium]